MDDKSALLNQLRIDRSDEPETDGSSLWKWLIIGAVGIAVAAALWWWLASPAGIPVRVAVVRPASAGQAGAGASLLDAAGYVVARRQATVAAKITGLVTEVLIEEGTQVKAGQVVARIDDTNIRAGYNQTQAQLEAARAQAQQVRVNLANAERDVLRRRGLAEQKLISVAELDTAQTALDSLRASLVTTQRNVDVAQRTLEVAQRNLDDTVVRAPFAGVITVKAAQVGEIISPLSAGGGFTRTGIGTIVDMESLEVEVDVNENFINRVQAGKPAIVTLNAYPDWNIPARVIAVIPTADRSKATVRVRVGFDEKDARVLPEMGARVSFRSAPDPANGTGSAGGGTGTDTGAAAGGGSDGSNAGAGVVVPLEALITSGGASSAASGTGAVFVVRGERVERRAVKLGAQSADGQTVIAGLAAGDRVVVGTTAERAALVDGAAVRVLP